MPFRNSFIALLVALGGGLGPVQAMDSLNLYAAGSLKTALDEVAEQFQATYGTEVATRFSPSGLLREEIEAGAPAQVFASANMRHPMTLQQQGKGGPVALFARNKLCALAQPDLEVSSETLLGTMLDSSVRVGTSTPGADPSGDYAWQLFARADAIQPDSKAKMEAKALQLTGGPTSVKAPAGQNQYGWVMAEDKADLFLTYCTNAVLAQKQVPDLQIVAVPPALAVGADYGLIVLDQDNWQAWRLALYILSPEAQRTLAAYGFQTTADME